MLRSAQIVMALMLVRGHAWITKHGLRLLKEETTPRQPRENLIAALMASDYEETQAKDHEELERQRQQIALMQQQLANMTEAQNNMSQTIAPSVAAALAAHGISSQAGHHPLPHHSRHMVLAQVFA
ncbi:hypothetical protein SLEP1_g51227 [Rubroshorea leprosula]|uniref:Uncharacterized protein n=1 Tax=Rubroshorea leprosula TaxID=152421 RepID=A0AAV5M4Z9_9ROSI|nr:hypothetical protein SLEP1_g51227 [Rubroshorea leprosula]